MEKHKSQIKKKIIRNIIISACIIIFTSCSTYQYKITPETKGSHRMIRLKFNYSDKENKNKGSGKVIVIKKDENKKMFILGPPLGRIYFKLILNKEKTTAVYVKKKRYWEGNFQEFMERIWGVGLSFDDFYSIVVSGEIPEVVKSRKAVDISIKKAEKGTPETIEIRKNSIYLKLKVLKNQIKSGNIDFNIDKNKLKKSALENLFKK